MNAILAKLKAFYAAHPITIHKLVVLWIALVTLYSTVPAFASLVDAAYAAMPNRVHEVVAAMVGIMAFYTGTKKAAVKK